MLKEFIEGDDEYRNSKFKIIPQVVEGAYFVQRAIGNTPAILGKKISTEYYSGDNWFEICVDIGSSRVAGSFFNLVKSYAEGLVLDLAFLFESQTEEELPEILLGGSRINLPFMSPTKDMWQYCRSREAYEQEIWTPGKE